MPAQRATTWHHVSLVERRTSADELSRSSMVEHAASGPDTPSHTKANDIYCSCQSTVVAFLLGFLLATYASASRFSHQSQQATTLHVIDQQLANMRNEFRVSRQESQRMMVQELANMKKELLTMNMLSNTTGATKDLSKED
jgi:hypothetical protein